MSELRLNTDGHIIKFGADNDVSLTHVADTGLLLNSTMQLQFNDASQNINAPSATVLDINATDEIELNATAVDLNGTLDVSGNSQFSGTVTVGVDDTGKDVKLFGATSGAYALWDESANHLILAGGAEINIGGDTDAAYGPLQVGYATDNNTYIQVLSDVAGQIHFGDSTSGDAREIGALQYRHDTDTMRIKAGGNAVFDCTASTVTVNEDSDDVDFRVETNGLTHALFLSNDNTLCVGTDTPNSDVGGMTLNSGASDANAIAMQSSDVAHGITNNAATSTYFLAKKLSATQGGILMQAYTEKATEAFRVEGFTTGTMDVGKSTSARSQFEFSGFLANGVASTATLTDNGNILSIRAGGTTRFIFDEDGDLHSDSSNTTFDAYEDAHLVRAFDLSHGRGVIDSKFDKFIAYNHEKLADLELVGREDDGTPNNFVNVTGMQRLHNGAIWQQYEKHNQLLEAVYELAKEAVGEEKANAILEKHEVKRLN